MKDGAPSLRALDGLMKEWALDEGWGAQFAHQLG